MAMDVSALQKIMAMLGEKGAALGGHAMDVGSDLGRMASTGGKWFAGRHPMTAAAAGGAGGALALEHLLGDDGEEEDGEALRRLMMQGGM